VLKLDSTTHERLTSVLLGALFVALMVSLPAAQIAAGLVILYALFAFRSALTTQAAPSIRALAAIAFLYAIGMAFLGAWHDGFAGFGAGIRRTWPILCAPAVAVLVSTTPPLSFGRLRPLIVYGFAATALLFLIQRATGDPAAEGRYGFHSAPYAFSLLLIPASILVFIRPRVRILDIAVGAILGLAILLVNIRGAVVAWLAATIAAFFAYPFEKKFPKRIVAAALVVGASLPIVGLDRWAIFDLEKQYSIQKRLILWQMTLEEIRERPWLGHGFDRFKADPAQSPIQREGFLTDTETNPHNGYLVVVHAAGMAGYAILWVAYGAVFLIVAPLRGQKRNIEWRTVAAANIIALLIAALSDKSFFITLSAIENWSLAGLAVGLPEKSTGETA
jgi:O-antigen ligase